MEGILIPQKVFIGDTAEYLYPLENLQISSKKDFQERLLKFSNIEKINQNNDMTVVKIEMKTKDAVDYLSISFIPWETGEIQFPDLSQIGINQKLPSINIASILESNNIEILQPPREPVLIPGTTEIIYSGVAVLVVFFFLILFSIAALRKNIFKNSFARIQRKRIKRFTKRLRKLKKKSNKKLRSMTNAQKEQYINKCLKEYETALREYCLNIIINENKKTKQNKVLDNLTYSEILEFLKKEFKNASGIYLEFKDVFQKLQSLRFGKTDFENFNFNTELLHFINKSNYIIKISEEQIHKNRKELSELNYDTI